MSKKQTLVIVICRANLQPTIIPPFKAIIPSLELVSKIRVYTSMNVQIKGQNLYSSLVSHLQHDSGNCNINETLQSILQNTELKSEKFRICLVGNQTIDWDIVMKFKRRKIIIDTAGSNQILPQISFVTGGINRKISDNNMVKSFLCVFGISTQIRNKFRIQHQNQIQFFLYCKCCNPAKALKNDLLLCSICLAPYCSKENKPQRCKICNQEFDQ